MSSTAVTKQCQCQMCGWFLPTRDEDLTQGEQAFVLLHVALVHTDVYGQMFPGRNVEESAAHYVTTVGNFAPYLTPRRVTELATTTGWQDEPLPEIVIIEQLLEEE